MSNNIFNLDPTTHQASLSKVNIGASEDASLIVLGKVTKVYYHQGTLDFKLTSGVSSIVADGSGNGTGSARIPLDYFGQDSEGRTYGHYRPVQIGDTVAIAYLNGHKTSPIVIGVYAPNGEQYEAISPTLFDSGDDKDDYIAETGLAEQHVHHSGQISYRSGSGRLFESLNGYSFMVIDDDTSQDYSELYTDLSLVPYSSIDGKTHDPQREKAGDWLLVHEDNPNGLDADNHITRFYVNKAGDFELVFTNTSFAGVSTVLHMDKNGMQLNKYIGHQKKKAGLPRASDEDQTYTADFDSAPTTVTFDLGKTKDDTISLKSSTTADSKEQATNLEVRPDGVYINDVKLFDSNSNSLAALSMFLDGGVMDFSKITVKNFSGDNITDGTIDGTKLKDKAVTTDKLNISKLSDISPDMGTITAGSIQVNNGTSGSTGVTISGDASSDPDILTPHDKAQLQQQLNTLYLQCQALMDYGNTVGIDVSELNTNENSLKNLTDWIFETDGNVKVDRVKIDEAITNFTGLLETYRSKFTSQLNQKIGETSNKANSIFQGSQEPDQANVKEGDLWLQTNSDGTSNIMQYTNSVWQEANLKGYQDAKVAAEQAQETADKLPHNYYQATEPSGTEYNDGDLWYQSVSSTSDGKIKYNIYKWDISSKKWVQLIDNNANANYVADSAPADPSEGDFWTDTDGTLHQYKLGTWQVVPTQGPQGAPGTPGDDGKTYYTWIKYATDSSGSSMSDTPTGMSYIGIAYNKESPNESSTPTDYKWSLIKGADGKDGAQGIPGAPGKDGQTTYFHIAYANSADGSVGFADTPGDNSYDYFGTYTDYTLTSSTDPTKYTWVKMFDSSKKRNFTTTPTTPYAVGDTWTQSGATYFCTTARDSGAFTASDWTMQQLTIQSLDNNLQANINGDKNLLMVDDVTYYSNPALDSTNTSTGSNSANDIGANLLIGTSVVNTGVVKAGSQGSNIPQLQAPVVGGETYTYSISMITMGHTGHSSVAWLDTNKNIISAQAGKNNPWAANGGRFSNTFTAPSNAVYASFTPWYFSQSYTSDTTISWTQEKLELGTTATPWSPNPEEVCYPFDYTSTDTTYTFQVQAKSTVSGDYVHMYPAWGNKYSQSQNKTIKVDVTTSPSVTNQTSTFNSSDSDTKLLLTTDWVTYTCTISGTWDKGSVLTALLGQVYNSETKGTVSFRNIKLVAGNAIKDYTSDDSITVAQGSNYWDLTTLQKSSLNNTYYTPWYPISEGQRVFLTHYDYPAYPGTTTSASVEFADSDHKFISNGTNNSQGSSTLDGHNSKFISPQSLGGVYYNERMLNISIVSQTWTSGTYQDLYIQTSGLLQSKLVVSGRGVTLATFDPYSGQRVDTQYWDTFATVDNVNAFVNYLKSISSQDLVVAIATRDTFINTSTDFQTASQDLCTLLQSYGLPSTYAPADLQGRVSFAFVGHTPAYQGNSNETLLSSSKGDNQVSTLTAYVSNGHISSTNNTRLVAYANAPAKTAYFRAGYSFYPDEVNRVNFMVTVDKLSTNYSSNLADVSSNAVRKDVTYKGVTLNDNGLAATADKTQVIVNSSNGFEIKKSGVDVFSVDTNGNLTITGSTISTGNISGVDFSGQDLTLSGTLSVNGSIVAANGSFTIDQNGMEVSPQGGGSFVISKGGLTIQGSSVGSQSTAGTYGSNDSLAGDAGLFATKDKAGNTKTWITSSGTLIAQDAVIHGNVSVDKLTLTGQNSEIVFGSGFKIDGNGAMTSTSKNAQISNGTYSDGVIEGSELDIGTAYHSKLSDADKYRYHVSDIGETTFGMSQDLGLMGGTKGVNQSYLSTNNSWTTGQVNFRGTGSAPTNASRALGMTNDIYADSYGWKHRFSAPVNGVSDTRNYIPIWDKDNTGSINQYTINYNITDPITKAVNTQMGSTGWGGDGTLCWTLSTVEFPLLYASLFSSGLVAGPISDLYPAQNQTIQLSAGQTYVFGAYIWHCGLRNGAKVTIMTSTSDSALQNTQYVNGNIVGYQQSGYSIVAYTPSSDVYLHSVYVEAGVAGGNQGDNYGVPLSVTDPFAIPLNSFSSKLFGGDLETLTSLGGRFGMPYPHLDASQYGALGLMRADNLTAGDKVVVSIPINYESGSRASFPQINLGLAKPGNDSIYLPIDGEFQPLMPGYYTYDFYFVWKDEYKQYINNNLVQLNLISKGISSGEKAYVVSVDSVRMGIFVGQTTTSSTQYVNEYQTKFSPLGSLQLSHISNVDTSGYTIAGQTQLTSEGLEITSGYSLNDEDQGGLHISINGKSGISVSGEMNFNNPETQPALSFYGYAPYNTLLEHAIEPAYNRGWDALNSASGVWFDGYGNVHGYDSSVTWNIQSPSSNSKFTVPLADGHGYNIAMTDPSGNPGSNSLRIGLIHFNQFGGGYVGGNYPAIYSGSGNQLAGIAFGAGYVFIFGNKNTTNNFWSFPQGTSDGHYSNSGTVSLVTN